MLGHAVNNLVLFLGGFHLPLPLLFVLMEILDSLVPVSQVSSQAFLEKFLIGPTSKVIF